MKVYILENAFWNLLLSSIEVYPKECLGLLIGSLDKARAIVHHAVVFQTAKRFPKGVYFPKDKVHQQVVDFLKECMPHNRIMGDFHSHTREADYAPSSQDQKAMESKQVYIVVQVYKKKRSAPWRYNYDHTLLYGTTREFYFKISCWYREHLGEPFKLTEIICPYAAGFITEKK